MITKPLPNARIVYFGTDAFSLAPLIRLLSDGWNVVAVVTKPDSPTGRGRQITYPAVKRLAMSRNIQVLQPEKLSDMKDELAQLRADIGIVVAYGKLIPAAMLDIFPHSFINVHASLLPRYRGASPIESALLNGDDETGVTLMQIEAGLDTGPTYDMAKQQLDGTENRVDLYEHLSELGADLLAIHLPAILLGQVVPIPQNEAEASTVGRIQKAAGTIDWAKPATILEREVRAYLGWPGSRTQLAGTDVTITSSKISHESGPAGTAHLTQSGELAVYATPGSLIILTLKPAGKREMLASEFLQGHSL
jgi:methionyl-tRNA formyltransferase